MAAARVPCNVLLLCLLLVLATKAPEAEGAKAAKSKVPLKGVNLSFPPFTSDLNCSLPNADVSEAFVCTPGVGAPARVIFSNDNGLLSARYAYEKKVQLFKKRTKYAASFSTSYTISFERSSDRVESGSFSSFGGGWAFAITPDQRVGDSGLDSIGLFEVDEATGKSLRGKKTKTVAVALDVVRTFPWDAPEVPHLELDINSVNSVKSTFLWDRTAFFDRKLAVFIDYDAKKEILAVRIQNLTDTGKPSKKQAKLLLSYAGLKLSDYVNEKSVVGFSSQVPTTERGVYILYDWKFSTKWVLTNKLH